MIYVPDVGDDTELMLGGPTANTAPTQSQPRATSNPMGSPPAQPGPRYYGRGGIPPFPQRKWVAVNAITREVVDTGIEQPDPDRLVLCACINKYGCICYGYYDEIPKWYRRIRILAIIFAIIATPISLLCFIPALDYMKKAEYFVQQDKVITARERCTTFRLWLSGGIIWVFLFLFVATIVLVTVIAVVASPPPEDNNSYY